MESKTVAQAVAQDYRTAAVFKRFGIDFCCGGKITISEACRKKGVGEAELFKALEKATHVSQEAGKAESLELDKLTIYIIDIHHSYVRKRLPEIGPFLAKVVRVHGKAHPELEKVQEIFNGIKDELISHMQKEEKVLFPYINEMMHAKREKNSLAPPFFGTIKNPIRMMEKEHKLAGDGFKEIRELTNGLTTPSDACNTYNVVFSMLAEFEDDLHRHIHLENNILFPQAIEVEEKLAA